MNDDQVQHMVQRFLGWDLPKNFSPDAGIAYTPPSYATDAAGVTHMPSGTNLFDGMQAEAMIRYLAEGMPE